MTRGHRKEAGEADNPLKAAGRRRPRPGGGTQGPGFQVDGDLAQRDVFTF